MCKLYFKSFLWINLFNSHNNHLRQKYNFSILKMTKVSHKAVRSLAPPVLLSWSWDLH